MLFLIVDSLARDIPAGVSGLYLLLVSGEYAGRTRMTDCD